MKFLKLVLISAAAALFVFACSQNQTTDTGVSNSAAVAANTNNNPQSAGATPDEFEVARKIYSAQCVNCHKENGTGGVTEFEGKKIKAPDFTTDRQKKEPDEEYVEIIEHGEKGDGMPAFKGVISDQEIKSLVKYIRREFQGKQS